MPAPLWVRQCLLVAGTLAFCGHKMAPGALLSFAPLTQRCLHSQHLQSHVLAPALSRPESVDRAAWSPRAFPSSTCVPALTSNFSAPDFEGSFKLLQRLGCRFIAAPCRVQSPCRMPQLHPTPPHPTALHLPACPNPDSIGIESLKGLIKGETLGA